MITFIPYTVSADDLTTGATIAYDSSYFGSSWKGEWSEGTYNEDDVVYNATTLHLYKSLTDSNTDNPTSSVDPATWFDLGYVNPWRMFDNTYVGEAYLAVTTAVSPLNIVLATSDVSHVGLFNILADSVTIELLDDMDVVQWSVEYNLLDDSLGISDWYDYVYAPYQDSVRDLVTELGYVTSSGLGDKIRITMTSGTGVVSISNCFLGYAIDQGGTRWNPVISVYSTGETETDSFGRTTFSTGENYKTVKSIINIEDTYNGFVLRNLSKLQNTPAVFDFNNSGTDYDILRLYGAVTSLSQNLPGPNQATIDCEIKSIVKKEEV